MSYRTNILMESYKSLNENKARLAKAEAEKLTEAVSEREELRTKLLDTRFNRIQKEAVRAKLLEGARNNALSSALKAIYITALEANSLTDNGIMLAESMVDTWIKENGGASKILATKKNQTYFLSELARIVEEAAQQDIFELEHPELALEADDESKEDESEEKKEETPEVDDDHVVVAGDANRELKRDIVASVKDYLKDASKEEIKDLVDKIKADAYEAQENAEDKKEEDTESEENTDEVVPASPEDDSEDDEKEESEDEDEEKESDSDEDPLNTSFDDDDDKEEEKKSEESSEETKKDEEDPDAEQLTDDEVDPDEDATEDDDINDALGEPIDKEGESQPDDITIDGDTETENKGKVFDELEKEPDVKKAIEIIRTRVADAEETFIKNNAEDKKKVEELLGKISDKVKTVEDLENDDSKEAKEDTKVAQESARKYKRQIDAIRENRPLTVLEKMTRVFAKNVVKDQTIRESYTDAESGAVDMDLVVESAKVMYGFLETLNTLQLEKVDKDYIKNVIETM